MRGRTGLALLIACIVCSVVALHEGKPAAGAQSGWQSKAPMLVARTAGVALTGKDGRIYVFGGTDGTQNFANAEVYTPSTDSWARIAPLPIPDSYMDGAVTLDGTMYLIGGWDGQTAQSTVLAYDPTTNTYACSARYLGCSRSDLASLPTPRANLAVTLGTDGLIYAIGGFNSQPVATVEAYDPASNVWHGATPLPHPSAGLTAITDSDGTIYVSGGFDGQNYLSTLYAGTRTSALHRLGRIRPHNSVRQASTVTLGWTEKFKERYQKQQKKDDAKAKIGWAFLVGLVLNDSGHLPLYVHSSSARHSEAPTAQTSSLGYAYITLGGAVGGPASNDVSIYAPATDTLYQGQPMPTARESAMAAVGLDNTIYIMGGDDGSGLNPFRSMDAWVPPPPPTATLTPAPTATPLSTSTPVPPTAMPTNTPTNTPLPTATPTPTPTTVPPRLSVRASVGHKTIAAGQKQKITVTTLPGAGVSITIAYPSGKKTHHTGTASASGAVIWSFKQPSGVTKGTDHTARITITAHNASGNAVTHKTYTIR